MPNEIFIVDDVSKFIESTRVLVFNTFGKTNQDQFDVLSFLISELSEEEIDELNKTLTQSECETIAKQYLTKQINKKTKQIRYTISTKKYMKMIESFNNRMISNMLHNMVNKGILETAYDAQENDFIFWVKEDENEEKPETD